jgi:hypothetical protein
VWQKQETDAVSLVARQNIGMKSCRRSQRRRRRGPVIAVIVFRTAAAIWIILSRHQTTVQIASPGRKNARGLSCASANEAAGLVDQVGHRRHVRAPRQVERRRRRLELELGELPDISAVDAPAADARPPSSKTLQEGEL